MGLKAEITKALREIYRLIRRTGERTSQEYDIAKARLTVCLLPIMSRILSRILATRLQNWAEATVALDENQAGFRQGGSTADAAQIYIRIHKVLKVVINMEEINSEREEREEIARRVSRPILWAVLEKYRLPSKVIDKLKDLHIQFTSYRVRGKKETVWSSSHREDCERGVQRLR